MLLIYLRPFNIPLWVSSVFGALLSLGLGSVDFNNVKFVFFMVWNSSLALVGLIIFALCLEKLGFFRVLANFILHLATHKKTLRLSTFRFYLLVGILSSFLASFFANDGAILILTPLILALLHNTKEKLTNNPLLIFLLFVGFLSDFASNTFIFSNLTNIITADFFNIAFLDFMFSMLLAQILVVISGISIFWLILGKRLPKTLEFSINDSAMPLKRIVIFCIFLIVLLLFGIIWGESFKIPLSVFTSIVALLSMFCVVLTKKAKLQKILQESPLGIVVFSLGLFIVVYGLKNMGLVNFLQNTLSVLEHYSLGAQIFILGFASSIGASVMNNLPMVMLGDLALQKSNSVLVYAHLLGCNIGAKLTPIGSLATLLWLSSLKRYGVHIGFIAYMKFAFLITFPTLCFGLLGLVFMEYL